MEIVIGIIIGIIVVAGIVYLLQKLQVAIAVLAWAAVAYLLFAKDNLMGACLIAGAWYAFHCSIRFVRGAFDDSKEKPKQISPNNKRKERPSNANWNLVRCVLFLYSGQCLFFDCFLMIRIISKLIN